MLFALPVTVQQICMKQEVYLMKKRMTAFLMMMILAVSVAAAALSDPAPAYCSHNNTYTEEHTDRYCIDANRHHIHTVILLKCRDCGKGDTILENSITERHNMVSYSTWVSATLEYTFRKCSECGYTESGSIIPHY